MGCTCGNVMVDTLHRDGGIGNCIALQVTHKALDATMNLNSCIHTHGNKRQLRFNKEKKSCLCILQLTQGPFYITGTVGRYPDKKLTVDTGTIDKIDYAPVLPKYLLLWL